MRQLEALVRQAEAEVSRQMQVCNACRYCESFCAVFPAMTRRLSFDAADAHYLANLCHSCGACLHACQYAPPHEFAINVPKAMAVVHRETYASYAWPRSFGGLYRRNGLTVALATAAGLALFLTIAALTQGNFSLARPEGNFYAVFPHQLLVLMFTAAFGWAMAALGVGAMQFWRAQSPGALEPGAAGEAMRSALALTYLDGGHGEGCNEESDRYTLARKYFHHFTFYGFMLCFASTCVATLYHYLLGAPAPYAFSSLPVILGTLGGMGLLIGPAGLFALNLRRHPQHGDPAQRPMDLGFIVLLFFTSLTGLALLVLRGTALMPLLLSVHLGVVMALFVTLPYGKFAHAVYRCAALLKWAIERRQPSGVELGAD